MKPEISECGPLTLVGMETRFLSIHSPNSNGPAVLGALWSGFIPRVGEITNRHGSELYGVVRELPEGERSHPDEHYYLAGAAVSAQGGIPQEMSVLELPAATYARFVHRGRVEHLGQTLTKIYQKWLPTSGYERSGFADLEVYGQLFRPESDDSQMEYWIPVKPVGR